MIIRSGTRAVIGSTVMLTAAMSHAAAAAAGPAREVPSSDRRALLGSWRLVPELSEDAREKMRQAGSWRRSGSDWARGGGAGPLGGGRSGGWGGVPRKDPESEALDESQVRLFPSLTDSVLIVTALEPELVVEGREGARRRIPMDGRKHPLPTGVEGKARWDKRGVVLESSSERCKVKEVWRLSPDGERLTIEAKVDRSWGPGVSVRRVFDRVPEPSARGRLDRQDRVAAGPESH